MSDRSEAIKGGIGVVIVGGLLALFIDFVRDGGFEMLKGLVFYVGFIAICVSLPRLASARSRAQGSSAACAISADPDDLLSVCLEDPVSHRVRPAADLSGVLSGCQMIPAGEWCQLQGQPRLAQFALRLGNNIWPVPFPEKLSFVHRSQHRRPIRIEQVISQFDAIKDNLFRETPCAPTFSPPSASPSG